MTSRLTLAFVAVALAAVAVLAALTFWSSRSEVSDLVAKRHDETASSVQAALADAYVEAGSWETSDLRSARVVAALAGAALELRDADGRLVALGLGFGPTMRRMHPGEPPAPGLGPPRELDITVDGGLVGTATLRFPASGPEPEREVRDALARTVFWGSALAALVAAAAGVLVARRLSRPLRTLTHTAHAMAAGDRGVRARLEGEPGEIGELARSFDAMADAVAREDALRRALVADVAHELRTPVTIVQGELEALLDGVAPPDPERLRSLHDEVLRLGRIVEDLGTLSAAEAAGLRLDRRRVDLAAIAASAIEAFRPQLEAGEVALESDLAPVDVEGDAARLGQVVRNLIANALKFTPTGGRVDVTVASADGHARLEVCDSGMGIPADELPHVFERFWRGRQAAGTDGSGIGLAVVNELVHAHGGSVAVASPPEGGAVFTVLLPRA